MEILTAFVRHNAAWPTSERFARVFKRRRKTEKNDLETGFLQICRAP